MHAMSEDDLLRYAEPEEVVRLARENGFSTIETVRLLSGCVPYRVARKMAGDWAPLLGITKKEFMELRKNG